MLPAFGLHTHIEANRRRSGLLMAGLFALVYLLTFAGAILFRVFTGSKGGPRSLADYLVTAGWDTLVISPVVTLAAILWIYFALRYNAWLVDLVTGAAELPKDDAPHLHAALEELCISRGMRVPALKVIEGPELNAYASGLTQDQVAITFTRGLLEALTEEEQKAVLAHELTHIRNEDVSLMVTAVVIAGILSFAGELVFRSGIRFRSSDSDKKGSGAFLAVLVALACILVAWMLSQVIRFALSRRREFLADAGAVELTKNPDAMISALLKIQGRGELPGVPSGVMEMCVDNPRSGFADIFATHPSVESRVDALVRFAGGRLPDPAALEALAQGSPAPEPESAPSGLLQPAATPWGAASGQGA